MANSQITYQLVPTAKALWVLGRGRLTYKLIAEHFYTLDSDENYYPGLDSIYDVSRCEDIDGEFDDLYQFSQMLKNEHIITRPCCTAIIIPDKNEKIRKIVQGLLLMISRPNIEHRYFFERDRALAYQFVGFEDDLIQSFENAGSLHFQSNPNAEKPIKRQ